MVSIAGTSWSQMPERKNIEGDKQGRNGMNLTEEQREQMKTFKIEFIKDISPLKNEIEVKNAQLHAASVGDNIDVKKVNKLIEEIGDLKTQIAKKHFAHKQEIRSILNDEQKVLFDSKPEGHGLMEKNRRMHKRGDMMNGNNKEGNHPHYKKCEKRKCPIEEEESEILE